MTRRTSFRFFVLMTLLGVFTSCDSTPEEKHPAIKAEVRTPVIDYSVSATYPHDINSFTEGFLFHDGKLFESTGSPDNIPQTRSVFGDVDMKTGKINVKRELDRNKYFGEGIVFLKGKLYQLTWRNRVGFVYDAKTFDNIGQFSYQNKEGWGMTTDGKHLIFSDGSLNLTYLDPETYAVVKTLPVTEGGLGVYYLNELEYIRGYIYANIWMSNRIVKIDPANGQVVGELDLTSLYNKARAGNINLSEMNGIAYDSLRDKILVTGKMWPHIYEVSFPH